MKIFIDTNSELKGALTRRFHLQGDVITPKHDAELCLTDKIVGQGFKPLSTIATKLEPTCFLVCHTLNKLITSGLGYDLPDEIDESKDRTVVIRFFEGVFWEQTLLTIPVVGELNDDLGKQTVSVSAGRYVKHSKISRLFDDAPLIEFLKSLKYRGFVSLELVEGKVVNIHLGIPFLGWLNALQGCRYDLAYWLKSPEPLLESWSVVVRVGRLHSAGRLTMPIPREFERRVWLNSTDPDKDSVQFESDLLGYVCTWNPHLRAASQHAIQICRSIEDRSRVYRTDFVSQIDERFRFFLQELDGA